MNFRKPHIDADVPPPHTHTRTHTHTHTRRFPLQHTCLYSPPAARTGSSAPHVTLCSCNSHGFTDKQTTNITACLLVNISQRRPSFGAEFLSFSLLSKKTTITIHRTIILPVVLYGCETWSVTVTEERRLRVFENRVLRRIFGLTRDEVTGEWRRLHNEELSICTPHPKCCG